MTVLAYRAAYLPTGTGGPFPTDPLDGTIEFAFGADLSADPSTWVWIDCTADWLTDRDLAATIGQADATRKAQPGKLNFWLKNPNGDYTKGNPMGAHWPYIRKNTPVRVTLDPGTGSVRQYVMYVTQWIPRWGGSGDSGRQPLVQVVANGIRRRLTQGDSPLRSPLQRALLALSPVAYWTLNDGSNATSAGSSLPSGSSLTATGNVQWAAVDTPGGDKAPELIDGQLTGVIPTGSANGFSVHFAARLVKADGGAESHIRPVSFTTTDGHLWQWDFDESPGNTTSFNAGELRPPLPVGLPQTGTNVPMPISAFDGGWHSYLMVVTPGAGVSRADAYVDGSGGTSTTNSGTVTFYPIGGPILIPDESQVAITNVKSFAIDHVAVYDRPLTHADAQKLASATAAWAGEYAGNRINRLCGEEGVSVPATAPTVTLATETFESTSLSIAVTGTWARSSTQAHSGSWSYKSATIGDLQNSDAVVTVPSGATSMSFWYKVSSEPVGDYLLVYLDGVLVFATSGEVGWDQRTLNVYGVKTVTFRYQKDPSVAGGSDAAWIDDITFTQDPTFIYMTQTAAMGAQKSGGLVSLLDECQEADGGILLDGLSPGFLYLRRVDAYNLPVAVTIDMSGRQFKAPFEPLDDDASIVNDETVTRTGGSSARYVDQTGSAGVNAIQRYDDSKTLNLYSDADLAAQAAWRVHLGTAGADALRFPGIGFDLHTAAGQTLIEPWLQGGIRTRAQVIHPPAEYGPGPIDLLVEGYTETVKSRRVWSVAANTSPYDPWRVFVVGDPQLGRIDTAGSQLAQAVSATATTLLVTSTTGLLWGVTGDPQSSFPFDLDISGIRIRVTDITGATSPQTFTVVRSMDGFDKALPAGAPVRLWRPAALAL